MNWRPRIRVGVGVGLAIILAILLLDADFVRDLPDCSYAVAQMKDFCGTRAYSHNIERRFRDNQY